MKTILLASYIAVLLGIPAATISASDYYIDPRFGSDTTGTGSNLAPWKTLTHAVQQIPLPAPPEGHTLNLLEGLYEIASGEAFPITLPPGVGLKGIDPSKTMIFGPGKAGVTLVDFTGTVDLRNVITGLGFHGGDPAVSIPGPIGAGPGPVIKDCSFTYNKLALRIEGPSSGLRTPVVKHCFLQNNSQGGILLVGGASGCLGGRLEECRVDYNQGVGVNIDAASGNVCFTISNSTMILNSGHGIRFHGSDSSTPVITHVTARSNSGAGLHIATGSSPLGCQIRNSIFHGNQTDFLDAPASIVAHCCFGTASGAAPPQDKQNGNLKADPQFTVFGEPDLKPFSPAIDQAAFIQNLDPKTDYAGDPRNTDGNGDAVHAPDMGADEYMPLYNTGFAPMPGSITYMSFDLPTNQNIPYYIGLSLGNGGILVAGKRVLPLWPDPVLVMVLNCQLPGIVVGFIGTMNNAGFGRGRIHWPALSVLKGTTFYAAGVTLEAGYPGRIRCVSNGVRLDLR